MGWRIAWQGAGPGPAPALGARPYGRSSLPCPWRQPPPRPAPPPLQVAAVVNEFREAHLSELQQMSAEHGTSLGYGYSQEQPAETNGTPALAAAVA